jgi:hypothetical protein
MENLQELERHEVEGWLILGMTVVAVLMMVFGLIAIIHADNNQDSELIANSIMGAILFSGGFVGACILWF